MKSADAPGFPWGTLVTVLALVIGIGVIFWREYAPPVSTGTVSVSNQ
jgi:hypothetical protein